MKVPTAKKVRGQSIFRLLWKINLSLWNLKLVGFELIWALCTGWLQNVILSSEFGSIGKFEDKKWDVFSMPPPPCSDVYICFGYAGDENVFFIV